MWYELTVILILVLANGLFAGAEIATVTLRGTRLEQLLEEGSSGAAAVVALRRDPERFLATVQIGITVVSMAAGAYGGDRVAERLHPLLAPIPVVGAYAHDVAFITVVIFVSYLSLVLGELVPKSLALRTPERYALLAGRPLLGLSKLARPLVWMLTESSNLVLRFFGDRTSFTETRMSPDELVAALEDAAEGGDLHPSAGEMASRAIEFVELTARDVMVPRNRMVAVPKAATADELRRVASASGHARFPVYEDHVDKIVGYVTVRDAYLAERDRSVAELMRDVSFVPESASAIDVLHRFQRERLAIAVVVDEHGGTSGVLTDEDLAEEILGEMLTEHVTPMPADELRRCEDGGAVLAGTAQLRDVSRVLDIELPESDDWSTVNGLCVGLAGHIPQVGERIDLPTGHALEVLDASPRRVRSARLYPPPPPPPVAADA